MRVLHLIDSLGTGGKERQLIELLSGFAADPDIDCEAVVMSDVLDYAKLAPLNVPLHRMPRRTRYDLSIVQRLRRVVKDFSPDIVHSWNAMCSIYGAPLAKLGGSKFVHGYVRSAKPNLTYRNRDYLQGKLMEPLADVIVANSMAGLAAFKVAAGRGVCIPNGFDQGRIAGLVPPEEMKQSLGILTRYVVGMVASFSSNKDHNSFFEMARRICGRRLDVTFVAVGGGEHLTRFRQMLAGDGLPIKLLGPRLDVESIVNMFTIGVLASNATLHGEGMANAIMEYMATGKPVVATDCGGNREVIEDGVTGFLVADRDVEALASQVLKLLDDPALAARMGARGQARIRDCFSLEKMRRNYARLYRDLCAGRRDWRGFQDGAE
ncbi:MAG TPA: glycosyltransferase [Rhizomicrobium sp.]